MQLFFQNLSAHKISFLTKTIQKQKGYNSMENHQKKETPAYTPNPEYDFFKANSATDCTGAVPRPPETDAELDSYLDVYNFLPQCAIAKEKPED